jgi:LPXTG-motif cell wall-anchored protein
VDRTRGLDPGGDTVTVSGIGHEPGSLLEAATWAVPDAEDGGGEPVADTANAVTVEADGRGAFSLSLDTGTGFAADAGPDASDAPFEVRLVEVGTGPDGEAPAEGAPPAPEADAGAESSEEDRTAAETTDAAGAATGARGGSTARRASEALAGPGRSAPVALFSAPAPDAVVGRVPVAFSAPAPRTEPGTGPQSRPQSSVPAAPVPREPGDPTLSVSKTSGLDPQGETVTVTGSGYDTAKGIYVALCDTSGAGPDRAPSPCVGGVDMEGSSGASVWVSSNPPPYGEGLAVPYTGGGTEGGFSVELRVRASDENTDCTAPGTECAVVTRNDHTRSSDRGQDVFVPVSFGGGSGNEGGSGGSGDSGDSGGSGSGDGSGSGSGGTGEAGTGGGSGSGSGPLPRTGSALYGLVLAAAVAVLTGAAALVATRRRARGAPTDTA